MPGFLAQRLRTFVQRSTSQARNAFLQRLRPRGAVAGLVVEQFRSRRQLLTENALLRQQLIVVSRAVKRPKMRGVDRLVMLWASARTATWPGATLIIKPETILRWHRDGFRLFWRLKSRSDPKNTRIDAETIDLLQRMARDNRLWGAERILAESCSSSVSRSASGPFRSTCPASLALPHQVNRGKRSSRTTRTTSGRATSSRPATGGSDRLRLLHHQRCHPRGPQPWRYQESNGNVDRPAAPQRHAFRQRPSLRHPRSRREVWRRVRPSSSGRRDPRDQDGRSCSQHERALRAVSSERERRVASTTSSSPTRDTWSACSANTSPTSTQRGHIKV